MSNQPSTRKLELKQQYDNINRWAVIVGISNYQHSKINLKYADRDAEDLYQLLLTPEGGGFQADHICKLTNEQATTGNINRALRSFLKKPAREDLVLIYFACHGSPDPDRPGDVYLLTHDTDPNDVAGTALPMEDIDRALKGILHSEKVIILADTCHSAAIGGGIGGRRSVADDSERMNGFLQKISQSKGGVALLSSAEANEVSFEDTQWGGGHGVFTHYLLEGMRGAGDRDGNGIVTIGELFEYVRDSVKQATGHRQHPSIGMNAYDRDMPIAIAQRSNSSQPKACHPNEMNVPASREVTSLECPDGAVSADSPFYVRSQLEEKACQEIQKPGALVRIKAPRGMGKSSLTLAVLSDAKKQNYRTVTLDFRTIESKLFNSLEKFAQWFCASVSKPLGIRVKVEDYWDDIFGVNDNCTDYFEKYLLKEGAMPLTLVLENLDRLFDFPDIEVDFCSLLRGWHEKAKRDQLWQQLRLIIVYSQESYEPKNINLSPFNVGVPIQLTCWTAEDIAALVRRHSSIKDVKDEDIAQLMELTGGYPHLVRLALYHLAVGDMTLDALVQTAAKQEGIYRSHLVERLEYLESHPELKTVMQRIVTANDSGRVRPQDALKLESMGLIKRENNDVVPLCQVYREYFQEHLN